MPTIHTSGFQKVVGFCYTFAKTYQQNSSPTADSFMLKLTPYGNMAHKSFS